MPSSIVSPFPVFNDLDGTPLEAGYIYIGTANLNPEASPINVFWDAALTVPAAQPIRTVGGYFSRNGSPGNLYTGANGYSITVRNRNQVFVFSALDQATAPDATPGADVTFIQAGTGAVTRTMQDKARETVSANDFGAVGDGVADDTAAIQAALDACAGTGKCVELKNGTYKVTTMLLVPSNTGLVGDLSGTIYAPAASFNNTTLTRYLVNGTVINLSGQLSSPFTPNTNQRISGIRIASEVLEGRLVDAIVARNCSRVRVCGNEITGFPVGCGIRASTLTGTSFLTQNFIHNFYDNRNTWPSSPQITAIEIDNDRVNSVASSKIHIEGNTIEDIVVGPASIAAYGNQTDGINIASTETVECIISNNIINNVGEGIDIWSERTVISSNTVSNCYNFGIKLIHGASFNQISSNKITNCGIAGIILSGSSIAGVGDCEKNNVTGNIIDAIDPNNYWSSTSGKACIKLDVYGGVGATSQPVKNFISGNLLNPGANGNYGIITAALSALNVFSNNRITQSGSTAWVGGDETTTIADGIKTALQVGLSSSQSIPSGVYTKVQFNSETFDQRGEYDNTTNYRWICQLTGVYRVYAQVRSNVIAPGKTAQLQIKRSTNQIFLAQTIWPSGDFTFSISGDVFCIPGQYIEIFFQQNDTVSRDITGSIELTYFSVSQI